MEYAIKEIKVNDEVVTHENGVFSITETKNITIVVAFETVATDVPPTDSGNGNENVGGNEEKSGCGSIIGASAGFVSIAFIGVALALKKKKED